MRTTPSIADNWLAHRVPRSQALLRLFCFPYAGGSASIFHSWSDALPSQIEVCPVQLPGRERRLREPPFTRLAPLLQALTQALRPYMNMPFALFGHSMGALISFELARELRRQDNSGPVHLFVSGSRAPQKPDPDPPVHALPEEKFIEKLRRLNGTPEAVVQNPELMMLVLPILRADFALYETYVYLTEEPLNCPISAFGGLQDNRLGRDDLVAWRDQTRMSFSLDMFPGNHFFLHTAQTLLLSVLSTYSLKGSILPS